MARRALVGNAADKDQVKKAGTLERERAEQQAKDLLEVLGTNAGRRFIWRVLCEGRIKDTTFSADPLTTAWLNGKRDLALWLEAEIFNVDANAMIQIRTEAAMLATQTRMATEAHTSGRADTTETEEA